MRFSTDGLFVKVSGVTSEVDALFCVGLGVNAIGFDFSTSPRQMSPQMVGDIARRLPPEVKVIGSFRNEMPQRIVEIASLVGLHGVQIEGAVSPGAIAYVSERLNTVMRLLVDSSSDLTVAKDVDYLVLPELDEHDALAGCLEFFTEYDLDVPIIASGGVSPSNVVELVQNYPIWGVDFRSSVESSAGVKDPGKLGDAVSSARWAYENALVARPTSFWLD